MVELKELDDMIFDLYCRLNGVYDHEKELFIPSERNVRKTIDEINELRVKVQSVKESVENSIWIQHLKDLLDGTEIMLLEDLRHPSKHLRSLGYSIIKILEEEERKPEEKAEVLISKLLSAGLFSQNVKRLCLTATDSRIERAITCAKNMQADFDYFVKIVESWIQDEKEDRAKKLYERLIEEFKKLKDYTRQFATNACDIKGQQREILEDIPYCELLSKQYGVPLAWILTWYEDEPERVKKKVEELAAKLDPAKRPIEVLKERIHTPYNLVEEMFAAMEKLLKIAREKAKSYLDFPEAESCKVIGVKEMEKDVFPQGHAGGPDPIKGGLTHHVALNQYNLAAFSKGWLMMMAIHETYYGHNIHSMKIAMADLPKTFKIGGGKDVPLVEGLAHRGEELLQHIYNDEAFPLFVAWRRLHTALRVYIDIGLFHLQTLKPEDAVRLYMEIMNFDEKTSKGLVEAHLERRGYFVCYLAGYKMIEEMRKKVDIDEKEFSNKLFSAGFVSMKCIKMLLGIREKLSWEYSE
jgi:tetratricopeptide (TPR) repeat protein